MRSPKSIKRKVPATIVAVASVSLLVGPASAGATTAIVDLRANVRAAVSARYPGSEIVTRDQYDKDCFGQGVSPVEILESDFNGDNLPDFVVQVRDPRHPVDRRTGATRKYTFVALIGKADGTFDVSELASFDLGESAYWYATARKDQDIYDWEIQAFVPLRAPALYLVRCASGADGFYWDGKRLKEAGGR